MISFIEPDPAYQASVLAACDEFDAAEGDGTNWTGCFRWGRDALETPEGFAAMCRERRAERTEPPEGFVPSCMIWAVEDGEWLGRVSVRFELTEWLREVGGHIGYAVRPSARRRGIATQLLRVGLAELAAQGVEQALVTCDEDNIGSAGVIERCGGVFEDVRQGKRRFWVPTAEGTPATRA